MKTKSVLEFKDAAAIVQACHVEATRLALNVSLAVVDDGGYPLRLERMDGAGAITPSVALAKAKTSALTRGPTRNLAERIRTEVELLRLEEFMPMQGGLPILVDGQCIGGIGVSGARPDQDEEIARKGVEAVAGRKV